MPNVFQRVGNWFSKQRQAYNIQKLLTERNQFVADTMREHDGIVNRINNQVGLTNEQREEMRLSELQQLYERPHDRENSRGAQFSVLNERLQNAIGTDENLLNPNNKSIGARLGRLFGGRGTEAARRQADARFITFSTTYGFTTGDENRLNQLITEREQRPARSAAALAAAKDHPNSQVRRDQAFYEAIATDQREKYNATTDAERAQFEAMTPEQQRALPNDQMARFSATMPPDPMTDKWQSDTRSTYTYQRQMQAFMKTGNTPEDKAYNLRVLKTFHDLDETGKAKDQAFASEVIRTAAAEFTSYDVNGLDLTNPSSAANAARYPDLQTMHAKGHSITDMAKTGAVLTDESYRSIFPSHDARHDYIVKCNYLMSAGPIIRASLLKDVDYNPVYSINSREGNTRESMSERANSYSQLQQAPTGLAGYKSYEAYSTSDAVSTYTDPRNNVTTQAPQPDRQQERASTPMREAVELCEIAPRNNSASSPVPTSTELTTELSGPDR